MKNLSFFLMITFLHFFSASDKSGTGIQIAFVQESENNIAEKSGSEPDYSNLKNWAASPFKKDTSDSIPSFLKNEIRDIRADAFFIHPTTYFSESETAPWNASLSDQKVNHETDSRSILFQATVFNGSCRVFAPRYRQANLKAFYVYGTPIANEAFNLAYNDVRKAFLYFIENYNDNRPIIIAAHSQGSLHAIRLLQDFFDGKPLQKRLVCAYIVGCQIRKNAFRKIPVGEHPDQTACFVGWRSYSKGVIPKGLGSENGNSVCVNPLTWTTSGKWASQENHLGMINVFKSIFIHPLTSATSGQQTTCEIPLGLLNEIKTIRPHCVEVGIEPVTNILFVDIKGVTREHPVMEYDLHLYDYNLFWMNIRQNVKQRIDAYYKNIGKL